MNAVVDKYVAGHLLQTFQASTSVFGALTFALNGQVSDFPGCLLAAPDWRRAHCTSCR